MAPLTLESLRPPVYIARLRGTWHKSWIAGTGATRLPWGASGSGLSWPGRIHPGRIERFDHCPSLSRSVRVALLDHPSFTRFVRVSGGAK